MVSNRLVVCLPDERLTYFFCWSYLISILFLISVERFELFSWTKLSNFDNVKLSTLTRKILSFLLLVGRPIFLPVKLYIHPLYFCGYKCIICFVATKVNYFFKISKKFFSTILLFAFKRQTSTKNRKKF